MWVCAYTHVHTYLCAPAPVLTHTCPCTHVLIQAHTPAPGRPVRAVRPGGTWVEGDPRLQLPRGPRFPNVQGKEAAEEAGGEQSGRGGVICALCTHAVSSFAGMHERAAITGSWNDSGPLERPPAHKLTWGAPSGRGSLPAAGLTSEGSENVAVGRTTYLILTVLPPATACSGRPEAGAARGSAVKAQKEAALVLSWTQDGHQFQKVLPGTRVRTSTCQVMSRPRGAPRQADRRWPDPGAEGAGGRVAVHGPVPRLLGGLTAGGWWWHPSGSVELRTPSL